jgi:hypothetical protein
VKTHLGHFLHEVDVLYTVAAHVVEQRKAEADVSESQRAFEIFLLVKQFARSCVLSMTCPKKRCSEWKEASLPMNSAWTLSRLVESEFELYTDVAVVKKSLQ